MTIGSGLLYQVHPCSSSKPWILRVSEEGFGIQDIAWRRASTGIDESILSELTSEHSAGWRIFIREASEPIPFRDFHLGNPTGQPWYRARIR